MWRLGATLSLATMVVLATLAGCSRREGKLKDVKAEPASVLDEAVSLNLRPVENKTSPLWIATYQSGGKTAKFGVELGPGHKVDEFASAGNGRFLREPGSDPTVLLADLKKALDAKTIPTEIAKADSIPFEYVVLGRNQSRWSDGGFSSNPPGDWTSMKIFLAKGEGEVFFNISPGTKKAEFSIKDSDYGDIVLAELAKVF